MKHEIRRLLATGTTILGAVSLAGLVGMAGDGERVNMANEGQLMITEQDVKLATQPSDNQSLMQIIEKVAASPDINVDKLQKLLELKTQWDAIEARKAYHAAMTRFKENPPQITKNKHVSFQTSRGVTEYDHATLDHVVDEITAGLSAQGIGLRWTTAQQGPAISVTCVLTHELGHSESTTLGANPDDSGGKNSIQAIGSAVTYLQRYTLLAACGMAPKSADDDAHSAESQKWPQMPEGWLEERLDWIANCSAADLHKTFSAAYKDAFTAGAKPAVDALVLANKKRRQEIG